MVPFLMLADVTTIVAAVPLAAATTAATAAAMSAFFTFVSFFAPRAWAIKCPMQLPQTSWIQPVPSITQMD